MKGLFILLVMALLSAGLLQAQPVITTDLTNQISLNGSNVTFAVSVSGTGPYTYQWQFDGTNLPNNIITTVAGNGVNSGGYNGGYAGDGGPATNAELNLPFGLVIDSSGNLYIGDGNNNCVRRVDTNGIITTVVGNATGGFSGNSGPATNASLNGVQGVAMDGQGNLYVADSLNCRIRKIDTNGIITTFAGNGTNAYSGDNGPATNASLSTPQGIAFDGTGNLYVADTDNNVVRRVDTNGIVTTFAGGDFARK
jgi:streptogramin lyase